MKAPVWIPRSKGARRVGARVAESLGGRRYLQNLKSRLQQNVDWDCLREIRNNRRVEVNQPLVLISQIQRSGGTLLSQLMDCHPECHTHPHELYIGYPTKSVWPALSMTSTPEEWWDMLREAPAGRQFLSGYVKYTKAGGDDWERFAFMLPPSLQKGLFLHLVNSRFPESPREVLDAYWTSYFNAWLDNQNLYSYVQKKYVVGFVPRMSMDADSIDRYFRDYPDGVLLNIIRDPRSWYVSARRHEPEEYADLDQGMNLWKASCDAMLRMRETYPGKTHIIRFESLVGDTEGTMRRLAEILGISFDPVMLVPTFNRMLIKADSSFNVKSYGVIKDPLERYKKELSEDEMSRITRETESDYSRVLECAL